MHFLRLFCAYTTIALISVFRLFLSDPLMHLILLGPPGTGKGTISEFIEAKFEAEHVSTGDLLRDEVAKKTEIGKSVEPILNKGALVDDSVVVQVLRKKLSQAKAKNFILDGFPRNLNQAKILDWLLHELDVSLDAVLNIDSSEDVIVKRLSARRQCVKCKRIYGLDVPSKKKGVCDDCGAKTMQRKDDKPSIIKKRLRLYNELTLPLIFFYGGKGLLIHVDGNRPLQEIFEEVETVLKKFDG